jgi:hypothetical protein
VERRRMKAGAGRSQRKMRKVRKRQTSKRSGTQNKSQTNVSKKIGIGKAERRTSGTEGERSKFGRNKRPRRGLESNEVTKRRERWKNKDG